MATIDIVVSIASVVLAGVTIAYRLCNLWSGNSLTP